MRRALTLIFALSMPICASAEVVALTPTQVEAAKEAGARAHARDAALDLDHAPIDRRVHGEVGVAVGTGGYSALYGTAVAPLGETGVVEVSVARETYSPRRHR